MAVSPEQLAAAQQAEDQATQALQAAEAEQQRILGDPRTAALQGAQAQAAVDAAVRAVRSAQQKNRALLAQSRTEGRALTPLQQAQLTKLEREEAQRQKNKAETGFEETDAEKDRRLARSAPRPINPVQAQNANTNAQRAAQSGQNAANKNEVDRIQAQIDALNKAGILTKDVGQQVSTEANNRFEGETKVVDMTRQAGQSLLTNLTQQREQDITMRNQRSQFIGNILTTAMPRVAEMMMKLPKGSAAAGNFLKAFLVMANMAYQSAGLDKDIPQINMNTPEMQNLRRIAGYEAKIPTFPSADQITWQTTKRLAAMGMPPPGYNGPIGPTALDLPDDPKTIQNVGGRVDDSALLTEVGNSPEGKAVLDAAEASVKDILDKQKAGIPLTPEDQNRLNETVGATKAELDRRVAALREQRKQERAAASDPKNQLKNEFRTLLTGENNDSKLNLMTAAVAGQQNRLEGKPLTPEQQIVLDVLDPEDVKIIQDNMTPDVAQLVAKHAAGQPLTDIERRYVTNRINNVSTQVKARPLTPTTPTAATPAASATPQAPAAAAAPVKPIFAPTPPVGEQKSTTTDEGAMQRAAASSADARKAIEADLGGLTEDERASSNPPIPDFSSLFSTDSSKEPTNINTPVSSVYPESKPSNVFSGSLISSTGIPILNPFDFNNDTQDEEEQQRYKSDLSTQPNFGVML